MIKDYISEYTLTDSEDSHAINSNYRALNKRNTFFVIDKHSGLPTHDKVISYDIKKKFIASSQEDNCSIITISDIDDQISYKSDITSPKKDYFVITRSSQPSSARTLKALAYLNRGELMAYKEIHNYELAQNNIDTRKIPKKIGVAKANEKNTTDQQELFESAKSFQKPDYPKTDEAESQRKLSSESDNTNKDQNLKSKFGMKNQTEYYKTPARIRKNLRTYYDKNKEKIYKYQAEYRGKNSKQIADIQAQYYRKNREKLNEYQSKYQKNNKSKVNKWHTDYRAKHRQKIKRQQNEYRVKNREKLIKQRAEYYQDKKEEINKHHAEYYQQNKERLTKYQAEYAKSNRPQVYKYHAEYREINKDKLNERRRALYHKNKQYHDSWRAKNKVKINEQKRILYHKKKEEKNKLRKKQEILLWKKLKEHKKTYQVKESVSIGKYLQIFK